MKLTIAFMIIAAGILAGCEATKGLYGGAKKDFSAVVKYGGGMLSYDPTNGTVIQPPPDLGPIKLYYPALEK